MLNSDVMGHIKMKPDGHVSTQLLNTACVLHDTCIHTFRGIRTFQSKTRNSGVKVKICKRADIKMKEKKKHFPGVEQAASGNQIQSSCCRTVLVVTGNC